MLILVAGQVSATLFNKQPEIIRTQKDYVLATDLWFELDADRYISHGMGGAEDRSRRMLEGHAAIVHALAAALFERQSLTEVELKEVLVRAGAGDQEG